MTGTAARIARRAGTIGLGCALGLGGCSDYLSRRDTLTLETGEAVQANIAKQVIDPWPAHARRVNRDIDGARLQGAIERYRTPPAAGGALSTVPSGQQAAPLAAGGLVR